MKKGFTVIELLIAIAVLAVIATVFVVQKNSLESIARDDKRKTAINAMYYNLEDVFFAKNRYYPRTISEANLTAMDKALFTDPRGVAIGKGESDYRYEPTGCSGERCTGYSLRALLENEADFVKNSRN